VTTKPALLEQLPETLTPPKSRKAGAWLAYVVEDGAFRSCPLTAGATVSIGRAPECDLVVQDPSVSRRHALLHVGDCVELEDLGSANGTELAGERLASGRRRKVRDAEAIFIGSTALFIAPAESPPVARAEPAGPLAAPSLRGLYRLAARFAAAPLPVLILGETGTGKDVLAAHVHAESPRRGGPYVRINCAAIAPNLIESELFGHEAGAFTGAVRAKPGLLETAQGGTAFLDEIAELPATVQAKLLHALENNVVMRVGGVKPRLLDVRFVCATNRDLEQAIEEGEFRRDLYFRINGVVLSIPPLRERFSDLGPLARHFLAQAAAQLALPAPKRLERDAEAALLAHSWPGNVRELRNAIFRATVLAPDASITAAHLGLSAPLAPKARPISDRERIEEVLAECAGNQTRAASILGISRRHLLRKIAAYRIPRPRLAIATHPRER
jgi:transcriptional regulator with AAA-type ATPase domain